jgi:PPM family protein phosphatase
MMADLTNVNYSIGTRLNTAHLNERGALLAVADGMGGAAAGEVASELAVMTVRNELARNSNSRIDRKQLTDAVVKANECIWQCSQQRQELRGMGTTLTAAVITDGSACIAQIGDSRAYLIRDGKITQVTKDQSLVQRLVDAGVLNTEEASTHPYRNVLSQALGGSATVKVEITEFPLQANDCLLICSDGLSNKVSDQEMLQIISESASINEASQRFIYEANRRGGEDNITVIIARYEGENRSTSRLKKPTGTLDLRAVAA